jgi:Tfp pilus assembly protein PilN
VVNINLLPEEARKAAYGKRTSLPAWLAPVGMGALVALAATTMTLRQVQELRSLQQEITTLGAEKEKYSQQVALLEDVQQKKDELERRVEAARQLDRGRGTYVSQLSALDAVLPSNVWLTTVTEEPGSRMVRIEGRSLSPLSVFALMRGLEQCEPFGDVSLEYLKKDPDQEMGATAFVLTSRAL